MTYFQQLVLWILLRNTYSIAGGGAVLKAFVFAKPLDLATTVKLKAPTAIENPPLDAEYNTMHVNKLLRMNKKVDQGNENK